MHRNTTRAEPGRRDPTENERAGPLFVQSVEKAMSLLSAFHLANGPLSLSELASRAGLGRSVAQRMVHTLRALGYIRRDPDGHGFLPGLRVLDHTLDYLRLDPLVRQATPVLVGVRQAIGERVDFSLFDDLRVVYAVRLQTKRQTLNSTLVGHSVPTFCTSGGWAILSRLPQNEARDIVTRSDRRPFTSQTLNDIDEIMEHVALARERGYALSLNQILSGEVAVGFPVLNETGAPVAAIHIAGSLADWTPEDFVNAAVPLGEQAARTLSKF